MITNLAHGVGAFTSNAFLVEGSRRVLVDTGANFDVVQPLRETVDDLDAIVLTHTHPDHVGNVHAVREAFGTETWGFDPTNEHVDHGIEDGEDLPLGDHSYIALHTPGHRDDHLCFYSDAASVLFAGDLVFEHGGFGRTDLPDGDRETLVASIDRLLETVDEALAVMHTGHGSTVTDEPYRHIEAARRLAFQS